MTSYISFKMQGWEFVNNEVPVSVSVSFDQTTSLKKFQIDCKNRQLFELNSRSSILIGLSNVKLHVLSLSLEFYCISCAPQINRSRCTRSNPLVTSRHVDALMSLMTSAERRRSRFIEWMTNKHERSSLRPTTRCGQTEPPRFKALKIYSIRSSRNMKTQLMIKDMYFTSSTIKNTGQR